MTCMHPTRLPRMFALAGLLGGLFLTGPALARQDSQPAGDLPAAKDLIETAINAMGGREALEKMQAMSLIGTMDVPMMNMSLEVEMHSAPKGRFLIKRIMPGMGEMSVGSDGTVAWTVDPMSGSYQLIEGQDVDENMRQASIHKILLRLGERFKTIETVERTTFDEEDTWKVRLVGAEDEQFMFFSAEEHFVRALEMNSPQGPLALRFKEWEDFDDVKLFKVMAINQGGIEMTINFKEIIINDTDAAVFQPPDEVMKMAAEQAAAAKPDEGAGDDPPASLPDK